LKEEEKIDPGPESGGIGVEMSCFFNGFEDEVVEIFCQRGSDGAEGVVDGGHAGGDGMHGWWVVRVRV